MASKTHCPCKDVGWTVEKAKRPAEAHIGIEEQEYIIPPMLYALTLSNDRPVVELRTTDGFVNATRMCQAAGKMWADFNRKVSTSSYLETLTAKMGKPISELVKCQHGGAYAGTWIHPQYAIKLAAWCSPEFELAVTDLVLRYTSGQVTTSESQHVALGLEDAARTVEPKIRLMPITGIGENNVDKGVYLGRPNGTWTQLKLPGDIDVDTSEDHVILKLGCSDKCGQRVAGHQRDYKGFELLVLLPSDDCRMSEEALKTSLRNENRLLRGWNSNKQSIDTELVMVRSNADLAELHKVMLKHTSLSFPNMAAEEMKLRQASEMTKQAQEKTKQLEMELRILKYKKKNGII